MCGIVGMAGNLNSTHNKMFRDMLVMDTIRGWDSTGIAFVPCGSKDGIKVDKDIGPPPDLWEFSTATDLMDRSGISRGLNRCMIGHNRAATFGKVTKQNAHPFTFGHITGCHNGTLRDWWDLEGFKDFDVDSKALLKTIADKGIDHCWENFFGAAAVVWWDAEAQTINLVRNSERPLYIGYSEKKDAVFWASEGWMIQAAAQRHKIKLAGRQDAEGNELSPVFLLKEHWLHSWKPTALGCPAGEVRELKKKSYATTGTQAVGGTTTTRTGGLTSRFNLNKKKKSIKINQSSLVGLEKADKERRGQEFKLINTTERYNSTLCIWERFVKGEFSDGVTLIIYPKTLEEFNIWVGRVKETGQTYYNLCARPRIGEEKGETVFKVTSQHVKYSRRVFPKNPNVIPLSDQRFKDNDDSVIQLKYKWFRGKLVSEKRWHEIMNSLTPKCSCIACDNPFSLEDHETIYWLKEDSPLCSDCQTNPAIQADLSGYSH